MYSNEFKKMKWEEFITLLIGLDAETPLGRTVQIRLEDDPKILKNFTSSQRRIRAEYRNKVAKRQSENSEPDKANEMILEQIKQAFLAMTKK